MWKLIFSLAADGEELGAIDKVIYSSHIYRQSEPIKKRNVSRLCLMS